VGSKGGGDVVCVLRGSAGMALEGGGFFPALLGT